MSVNDGSVVCLLAGKIIALVLCARVMAILVSVTDYLNNKRSLTCGLEAFLLELQLLLDQMHFHQNSRQIIVQ